MNKHKRFLTAKIWIVASLVIFGYMAFMAGLAAAKHWYAEMGFQLLLSTLWLMIAGINIASFKMDAEIESLDREIERSEARLKEFLDNEGEDKHAEELADTLMTILREVAGKGNRPTPAQNKQIKELFHERTGHYARIVNESNKGATVEVSPTPFNTEAEKQPEEVDAMPVKPLTKSQQRRINVKKGVGPVTDEELRELRNIKRREARAAKKQATLPLDNDNL